MIDEKQLITDFIAVWNETAATTLGCNCEVSLVDEIQEIKAQDLLNIFSMSKIWSAAFVAAATGTLTGNILCIFKNKDTNNIERLSQHPESDNTMPGCQNFINGIVKTLNTRLTTITNANFQDVNHISLSTQASQLTSIITRQSWLATLCLSLDNVETEMMLCYSPQSSVTTLSNSLREEKPVRNIERLLHVELDIVVRFGSTNIPLSEIVRMGTGSMIELNRAVDEPVELLVNGHPLARGEVVVIDGYYGVRITEIISPAERALSLL